MANTRKLFSDIIRCSVPPGAREAVELAARREHMSVSAFTRRAVLDKLEAVGLPVAAEGDPGSRRAA